MDMKNTKQIILASSSPRRKELLEKIGLTFKVDASDYAEDLSSISEHHKLAIEISRGKAQSVAARYNDAIIIGVDTFGVIDGMIIGKPHTPDEAKKMLGNISGRSHIVISGFTIIDTSSCKMLSESVETKVFIKKLTTEEIDAYVKTGEPLDKAGAYGIQGLGALIVERIEGDYYNVIGLPLFALTEALKEFGISIL